MYIMHLELPARVGGLDIVNLIQLRVFHHTTSKDVSGPLVPLFYRREPSISLTVHGDNMRCSVLLIYSTGFPAISREHWRPLKRRMLQVGF